MIKKQHLIFRRVAILTSLLGALTTLPLQTQAMSSQLYIEDYKDIHVKTHAVSAFMCTITAALLVYGHYHVVKETHETQELVSFCKEVVAGQEPNPGKFSLPDHYLNLPQESCMRFWKYDDSAEHKFPSITQSRALCQEVSEKGYNFSAIQEKYPEAYTHLKNPYNATCFPSLEPV